jgi:broad specificity phosphatase PhoE
VKLIAIRHLMTPWNKRLELQGARDISIISPPDEGAQALVESQKNLLKKTSFDSVYVSPLKRTQETSAYYGYVDFVIDPYLQELNFGEYEGKSKQKIIEDYGQQWLETPSEIILGEPMLALQKRVTTFISRQNDESTILVFGHGNWIRALMSLVEINSINNMNKIHLDNSQLVELDINLQSFQKKQH